MCTTSIHEKDTHNCILFRSYAVMLYASHSFCLKLLRKGLLILETPEICYIDKKVSMMILTKFDVLIYHCICTRVQCVAKKSSPFVTLRAQIHGRVLPSRLWIVDVDVIIRACTLVESYLL